MVKKQVIAVSGFGSQNSFQLMLNSDADTFENAWHFNTIFGIVRFGTSSWLNRCALSQSLSTLEFLRARALKTMQTNWTNEGTWNYKWTSIHRSFLTMNLNPKTQTWQKKTASWKNEVNAHCYQTGRLTNNWRHEYSQKCTYPCTRRTVHLCRSSGLRKEQKFNI